MYDRLGSAYTSFSYGYGPVDPSGMEITSAALLDPAPAPWRAPEEVLVKSPVTGWWTHMPKTEAIRRGLWVETADAG